MKVKMSFKIGLLAVIVGVSLSFFTSVNAAVDCAEATVTMVGVLPLKENTTTSKYMIRADCADDSKWTGERQYMLSADIGDSGYATLLTAMSLNQPIYLRVESANWWSLATLLYLSSSPSL
ncbi:MAG: hypothetical protein D3903_00700 [Candidatus Electrothrix sp. GM3_4]|nr:hypothetical protein [Candidatus Electrothrix sp. GM3_4]